MDALKFMFTFSTGKLKHSATVEFGAPIDLNVYCQVSPEYPEGVLLTRAILNLMSVSQFIIMLICMLSTINISMLIQWEIVISY
jgi:hypothetical protein